MKITDLRSDTLTKPSNEMRQAMANAEVGDDVFEEDPTIQKLEQKTAALFQKEAALFTATGTQSNLIASIIWNPPGSEVIADSRSHLFYFEAGGTSRFGGAQIRPIQTANGILSSEDIDSNFRADNIHYPKTTSVFIENTHNIAGGKIYPITTLKEIYATSQKLKIKIHMDGARLFNAIEKLKTKPSEVAKFADSVTFCLSKGLGCPVGSMLMGDKDFIKEARRIRKALGGGMRQAGVLAAAGIYALDNNVVRLNEDHHHAEILAKQLIELNQEVNFPETNIVIWKSTTNALKVTQDLREKGVLAIPISNSLVRFVTHLDIKLSDVTYATKILKEYLGS